MNLGMNARQREHILNLVFISLQPCCERDVCFEFQVDLQAVLLLLCCSETDFSAKQICQPGDQLCRVVTKVICFPLFVKYNFLQPA